MVSEQAIAVECGETGLQVEARGPPGRPGHRDLHHDESGLRTRFKFKPELGNDVAARL